MFYQGKTEAALTLLEGSPAPLEQSRLGQWGDGLGTSVQEFWLQWALLGAAPRSKQIL